MNDMSGTLATLSKPYTITRSRLGAITKIFDEKYVCDIESLKEIFSSIGEKLHPLVDEKPLEFSFLVSFTDKTHRDGVGADLNHLTSIPTGKQTDRIVMRWIVHHKIDVFENELSITIRIANPVNPLVFLQAALSKSANEIDNMEFEMGSTCVTVDGAGVDYSDEIFLKVQKWINARRKPHPFIGIQEIYKKYEWYFDQLNFSLFPLLSISAISFYVAKNADQQLQITLIPILLGVFFVLQTVARLINTKMDYWAKRTMQISLFQITNGDQDFITKMVAKSKNSFLKLSTSAIFSFTLNVLAAVFCWKYLHI